MRPELSTLPWRMSASPLTETITWNPIDNGEPERSGKFLITCSANDFTDHKNEVIGAMFEDGIWEFGLDNSGDLICVSAIDIGLPAWADLPKGCQP